MLFRNLGCVEKVFSKGTDHSFEGFKVRCNKIRLKDDQIEEVKNTKKETDVASPKASNSIRKENI